MANNKVKNCLFDMKAQLQFSMYWILTQFRGNEQFKFDKNRLLAVLLQTRTNRQANSEKETQLSWTKLGIFHCFPTFHFFFVFLLAGANNRQQKLQPEHYKFSVQRMLLMLLVLQSLENYKATQLAETNSKTTNMAQNKWCTLPIA